MTDKSRPHINADGEFQSDKYPTCPAGKVPLSTADPTAQDLLWEYAQRRRDVDAEFADDLEYALLAKGWHEAEEATWADRQLSEVADALPFGDWQPGECSHGEAVRRIVAERDALRATLRALVDMHSPASQAAALEFGAPAVAAFIARRHPELGQRDTEAATD